MGMLALNELLPRSQWEPSWTFRGADYEGLANDEHYVIFEYYCDNPACYCENLCANIVKLDAEGRAMREPLAVISYDWSSKKKACYPHLDERSLQTASAQNLLEVYKKFIHHPNYLARIKEHYSRVKTLAAARDVEKRKEQNSFSNKKIGRNDACPCGSGKKSKKCCLAGKLYQDK